MNKLLVVIFDNEAAAYKGLNALRDIHNSGDITLYAAAVIVKDSSGAVSTKETLDEGPVETALGILTGSIIGLLGGPTGLLVGASLGGLTGALFDLNEAGIDIDFVDEISSVLTLGKAAVIADVEETWTVPVNAKIEELGGHVYRRLRSDVFEDQLVREQVILNSELDQLETELQQAHADHKATIQKQIDSIKKKMKTIEDQVKSRIAKLKTNTETKIAALKEQMEQAKESQKEKIEKRIAHVKAEYQVRNDKLKQANVLIKQAVFG